MDRSRQDFEQQLRAVCASVPVGVFFGDLQGNWTYVNAVAAEFLGEKESGPTESPSPDSLLLDPPIDWLQRVHAGDRDQVASRWSRFLASEDGFSAEFRLLQPDGSVLWVQADANKRSEDVDPSLHFIGTLVDTTAHKETEEFLELESELLEAVARGLPLEETLQRLMRFIESQSNDMLASVLLLDPDSRRLLHGAAPSLDPAYIRLVDGVTIGEGVGSCGTAAYRGEPVFVEDIETDPLWDQIRHLVRPFGLRACWSTPLKDRDGVVLGTFGVYRSTPGRPTAQHLRIIEVAAHLASIVLARHRDDQKLLQNEQRFRRLFEHAAVGVAQVESNSGVILRANRRFCEILKMREEQLRGVPAPSLTHPEHRSADQAQMARLLAGEIREYAREKRLRRGDGSFVWVNSTVSSMWQAGSQPTTYSLIIEDITIRKHAEEALRLSEKRFRNLVQTAPFGVLRSDLSGKITFANAALGTIYECSPGDLIGKAFFELAGDASSRRVMRSQMLAGPASGGVSEQTHDGSGVLVKHRTVLGRAIEVHIDWARERNRDGQDIGWIVVVSDVTKRREFERQLEFQADILNRVSDAVIVTDQGNVVTYANEAAERMFEINEDHRCGRALLPLHDHLLVSGPTSREVSAALEARGQWQGDIELPVEGRDATVEAKLKLFRSPNSEVRYLLSVVRDISMRKQAEQERRQHRDALAHMTRLSTMGELVAGIAHEVRQPLYAIANFATAASISLRNLPPDAACPANWLEDMREFHDGIRRASQRANEIIERLRSFTGKRKQSREPIDLNEVIRASVDLVAFEARQCDTVVQLELEQKLPPVVADRIQCEQVLVNLLHNAYEALAKVNLPRRVLVRSRHRGDMVEIDVEDNGIGVPASGQANIFEAFCTNKPHGMGMGLAISRTIVEDHGGKIVVNRNRLGGATFSVCLPVAAGPIERARSRSLPAPFERSS